jgi:hypothetical protein
MILRVSKACNGNNRYGLDSSAAPFGEDLIEP